MKVLLISANQLIEPYPVYPIGLDYVAAALTPAHEVRVLDRNHTADGDLVTRIRSFAPEVVGLSLRNIDNTDISNPLGYLADLQGTHRPCPQRHNRTGGSGRQRFHNFSSRKPWTTLEADYGIIRRSVNGWPAAARSPFQRHRPRRHCRRHHGPGQHPPDPTVARESSSAGSMTGRPHLQFYLQHSGMPETCKPNGAAPFTAFTVPIRISKAGACA